MKLRAKECVHGGHVGGAKQDICIKKIFPEGESFYNCFTRDSNMVTVNTLYTCTMNVTNNNNDRMENIRSY